MFGTRLISLTLCLCAAVALPALAADKPALKVKPGLWEMTSDSERSGTPPIPPEAAARMSPEQRARFEAALQQSMAPRHRVVKRCVTQADIDQGFAEMDRMDGGKCTQKVASSTATLRAGTFTCSGRETASGTYRFEAPTPETVIAHWDVTLGGGEKTMKMKNAIHGKWLASDCGSVKPSE